METHEHQQKINKSYESWLKRHRWIGYGAVIIIAYYLLTEHQDHLIAYYPYLFLASCALMHVLMHGGHHHHHQHHNHEIRNRR